MNAVAPLSVIQVQPVAVSEADAARMFDLSVNSFKKFAEGQGLQPRWIGGRKVYLVTELQALAPRLSTSKGTGDGES